MSNVSYEEALKLIMEALKTAQKPEAGMNSQESGERLSRMELEMERRNAEIPVGVPNRHIHLSQKDQDKLFGPNYEMTKMKELSQPGQFACKETVTVCGPNGAIEKVRILGPVRPKTQIEILEGDCYKLGVRTEPRMSGELEGTPGITLIGPKGSVETAEGVIVAMRHIHMTLEDAARLGVHDGQCVSIEVEGIRGGTYKNVAIRANNASALECHIDTEEANAMKVNSKTKIKILK